MASRSGRKPADGVSVPRLILNKVGGPGRRRHYDETVAITTSWVDHADRVLAGVRTRRTRGRRAVIELLGEQSCALTAPQIDAGLRARGRPVGRATVYRTLEQLVALGLVHRVVVGQANARFEAAQPDGDHHHHLVCDRCGAVAPFSDRALERSIDRLAGQVSFAVEHHEVVLHGSCASCR